jgi:eukaryotic-like serine/threonine-protein kinase
MTAIDPSAQTVAEPDSGAGGAAATDAIGKYRLDRVIGSGGMGVVWAAFDPDLERAVAVKALHATGDSPTLRARLLREARAMARLKHPNVVTVYDVGTDRNRDYIAMELVEGTNLDAWLETRPPRPEILDALLGAGRGLAAAHDAGLVHRDFKPHNVLRSGTGGHVYVTDFGLARGQLEDGVSIDAPHATAVPLSSVDSPLTQTGVLVGTPAYMAPEQFAHRVPDPRTDQFAFCVTAWEALTGDRPFRGESLGELEAALARGVPADADLPPRLRTVLERGLARSPDERYADIHELLRALESALEPEPAKKTPWKVYAVAAASVVAVSATITTYQLTRRPPSRPAAASAAPAVRECASAERAFDRVWSSDRRSRALHDDDEDSLGAIVLLDSTRRDWVNDFEFACNAKATSTRDCLLHVRDDLATLTSENALEIKQLAIAAAGIDQCARRPPLKLPPPPAAPEPPAPPEPPKPDE